MEENMKHKVSLIVILALVMAMLLAACNNPSTQSNASDADKSSNKVVIYSGAEEYRNEYFLKRIKEEFPDYDVTIEYMPTGNLAAKLAAEGTATDMDIFYDLDFSYAGLVEQYLADVSSYDQSIYVDDCKVSNAHYLAATRNGGAIIVNPDVLAAKGIDPKRIHESVAASGGSIGLALELAEDDQFWELREDVMKCFFRTTSRSDVIKLSNEWKDRKQDAGRMLLILESLTGMLSEARFHPGKDADLSCFPPQWQSFSAKAAPEKFTLLIESIVNARKQLQFSVNYQAVLERLIFTYIGEGNTWLQ